MENTSPARKTPAIVHVDINISIASDENFWRDPSGRSDFSVSLPIDAANAINLNALMPSLVAQAKAKFFTNLAEMEAKAKETEEG